MTLRDEITKVLEKVIDAAQHVQDGWIDPDPFYQAGDLLKKLQQGDVGPAKTTDLERLEVTFKHLGVPYTVVDRFDGVARLKDVVLVTGHEKREDLDKEEIAAWFVFTFDGALYLGTEQG